MGLVPSLFPDKGRGRVTVAIGFRRPCPLLHLTVTVTVEEPLFRRWAEERSGLFGSF